jgi:sporulation protein YlmC with PRC-barrel domain
MLKKILATTALSALLAAPVLAQDAPPPDDPIDPPVMEEPAPEPGLPEGDVTEPGEFPDDPVDTQPDTAPLPGTDAAPDTAAVNAEDVIGAELVDFEGNSIATVDDVVIDAQGGVEAVLVNVGGFLGFGARTVVIPMSDVTVDTDIEGEIVLRTALTSEDLENMPEHQEEPEEPPLDMEEPALDM